MSDARDLHLEPAAQHILQVMTPHPERAFTPEALAQALAVPAPEIRAALAKLERLGCVDREHQMGEEAYIVNPSADHYVSMADGAQERSDAMTDAPVGPTAQKILELMQQNRGTAYTADDICERVDCSVSQAQTALETLAHRGLIDCREHDTGLDTYQAR